LEMVTRYVVFDNSDGSSNRVIVYDSGEVRLVIDFKEVSEALWVPIVIPTGGLRTPIILAAASSQRS